MKTSPIRFLFLCFALSTSLSGFAQQDHPGMADMPGMSHPAAVEPGKTAQQAAPSATKDLPPAPGRDRTLPVLQMQEQENLTMHTGHTRPTPDLLHDAATRPAMSLVQFQAMATNGSPTLRQAEAQVARSEGQARQASLPPNPTVGYSGEHIRGGSYHGGEEGAFVQQTIVLGGKLGLRSDVYRREADANRARQEAQRISVQSDVEAKFYAALAAQARSTVRQDILRIAEETSATTHQLANLGQADATDVLQAEVEAEQAQVQYVAAQREYIQRFRALAAVAATPDLPLAALSGELEAPPILETDAVIANILAQSPALRAVDGAVAVAEAQLKQVKREPVPDISVQAGEWYSGDRLDGTNKAAGWMGFAQVGVEIPLWNRNQGASGAAIAEAAVARAGAETARLELRAQAETLAQDYLTARFEAEQYRDAMLPRARRAYELSRLKYNSMAGTYAQLLLSQRTLSDLRVTYLQALEREWEAAVQLQNYALGASFATPRGSAEQSMRQLR